MMWHSNVSRLVIAGTLVIVAVGGCSKKPTLPPVKLKPGTLEFCIVANDIDDEMAIVEAKAYFEKASIDAKLQSELRRAAEEGKPPPAPKAKALRFAFNGHETTYRWVELPDKLIDEFRLRRPDQFNSKSKEVADGRAKGQIVLIETEFFANDVIVKNGHIVVWSRNCIDKSLSSKERDAKSSDYFFLIRESEPGKEITEADMENIEPVPASKKQPAAISITLTEDGGRKMRALTEENQPTKEHGQYIAIILHGKLHTYTMLRGVVGEKFQISGNFTDDEVQAEVKRLRDEE